MWLLSYEIFKFMPETVQCAIFSATMPLDVLDVTKKFMRDPIRILVKKEELTLDGIKQFYVAIGEEVFFIILYIYIVFLIISFF